LPALDEETEEFWESLKLVEKPPISYDYVDFVTTIDNKKLDTNFLEHALGNTYEKSYGVATIVLQETPKSKNTFMDKGNPKIKLIVKHLSRHQS